MTTEPPPRYCEAGQPTRPVENLGSRSTGQENLEYEGDRTKETLVSDDVKITRLKSIELFKDADKKALQHLASAADEIEVKAGTVLITEGHVHHEGYIIAEGTVCVIVGGEEVAEIAAGELVGELALFGHNVVASATVKAKTNVRVFVLPYNRFDEILEGNPSLTKAILRQLAGRLQAMDVLYKEH